MASRRRRLLYVNLDFPPMSGPGIWRALGFAKYLPEHGVDVTVLCSDRSPTRTRYDESLLTEVPAGTTVHRIGSWFLSDIKGRIDRIPELGAPQRLERRLLAAGKFVMREYPDAQTHWALKVAAKGAALALSGAVDAIFTSGPPHISHVAGLLIRRVKRIPWIIDYRDLWTDDRVQIRQASYQQRFFERVEARVVGRVDEIVCVSPAYREHLLERFAPRIAPEHVHVIRNGHDLPPEILARAADRPANDRLHVHFNGTPQYTHPFGLVVDTVARLVAERGADRAPLVTFTGFPANLREEVDARGLSDHVVDVGHMPRLTSIEYSLGCDVLLAMVNDKNPLYRGTIPGKAYEALAIGRHLLALLPKNSVVGDMIDESGNGTLANVGDPEDVYRAFTHVLDLFDRGVLHDVSDEARARVASAYSRRTQAGQLAALLERVAP